MARSYPTLKIPSEEALQQLNEKVNNHATKSLLHDECILDVSFTLGEVVCAVRKLKAGKACGHDGISAEHLKWGGETLHLWLLGICNAIIQMEEIPCTFKLGSICPVYKGGGKDPFLATNYQ